MNITEIAKLGLWPESKKTTAQKGISELEDLGYNLFYIGKNADLVRIFAGQDIAVFCVCRLLISLIRCDIHGFCVSKTIH